MSFTGKMIVNLYGWFLNEQDRVRIKEGVRSSNGTIEPKKQNRKLSLPERENHEENCSFL